MNQTPVFALCVRMSAIGDVVMTARALYLLNSCKVTPILLTSESLQDIPSCFVFLNYFFVLKESGQLSFFARQASGEFLELADLPEFVAANIRVVFDLQGTSRSRRAIKIMKNIILEKKYPFKAASRCVEKRSLFRFGLVLRSQFNRQSARTAEARFEHLPSQSVVLRQLELVQQWLNESTGTNSQQQVAAVVSNTLPQTFFQPIARTNDRLGAALGEKYCVLFAGASLPLKAWPLENCRAFVSTLEKAAIKVVLIGGVAEQELAAQLAADHQNVVSLTGLLKLQETFWVINNATLVVTTDSFAAHVCDLLNKKTIVLFGATTPRFGFAPLSNNIEVEYSNLSCSPCTRHGQGTCRFQNHACMKLHKGTEIAERVKEYFESLC